MDIKSIIPNTISVSEQFEVREKITGMISKWTIRNKYIDVDLVKLEQESGLRCHWIIHEYGDGMSDKSLAGFYLVDSKIYAWFCLNYA